MSVLERYRSLLRRCREVGVRAAFAEIAIEQPSVNQDLHVLLEELSQPARLEDISHLQNTQNREARAINLKLDEIIRSIEAARNGLIDLEDASDEQLEAVERQFKEMSEEIREG